MQQPDTSNPYFDMAVQFVNYTGKHLFLTGKAGTGKTTFLKYIKNTSPKKMAVVAPTGVAAINAGGVTIHAFFQLPLGTFLPDSQHLSETSAGNFYNRGSLLKKLRLSKTKRTLMRELDLLVIDEVSMVRADILDAVDAVLRHIRRQPGIPFGGVQMLFIGDLFQLPPVAGEGEWEVLKAIYPSPFFFHARALSHEPPLYIELKKIYRQSDADFIGLLNDIRNNRVSPENIARLHSHYRPGFVPDKNAEYITLTSHNYKAESINGRELEKLAGKAHTFEAEITGEFNERSLPAEKKLTLKEGAQIMFIRNDKGESRRYYNGKIGTVKKILSGDIYVTFPGDDNDLLVERETWSNLHYAYNKEEDRVEEIEIGTFSQYPVRLAWAITIHKSQGLTFSKAIIDAGSSFAPGQVYVALSRLTSLEGLVLYSRIHQECISTDAQAVEFAGSALHSHELLHRLKSAKKEHLHHLLLRTFHWSSLESTVKDFDHSLNLRRLSFSDEARQLTLHLLGKVQQQQDVAQKFIRQLLQLLPMAEQDAYKQLHERVQAASGYFSKALQKELIDPLRQHHETIKKKAKAKAYLKDVQGITTFFTARKEQLQRVVQLTEGLKQGTDTTELLKIVSPAEKPRRIEATSQKPAKGESQRISLAMFREGKDIPAIARERGFVTGTIASHLASFILTGEIDVTELVETPKLTLLNKIIGDEKGRERSASQIKEMAGDAVSYHDIRAVMNHHKMLSGQSKKAARPPREDI